MDNDIVRRLMWSGLLAGTTALAGLIAARLSAAIWTRIFDEDPPL